MSQLLEAVKIRFELGDGTALEGNCAMCNIQTNFPSPPMNISGLSGLEDSYGYRQFVGNLDYLGSVEFTGKIIGQPSIVLSDYKDPIYAVSPQLKHFSILELLEEINRRLEEDATTS